MSKENKSCYNRNDIWPKEKNQKKMDFLILTWLMKKWMTQGKEELVYIGWYTSLLGTVVVMMQRKSSLIMAQEALESDKVLILFQSMEKRRALAHSKSVRWYSQTLRGGGGKGREGLLTNSVGKERRKMVWRRDRRKNIKGRSVDVRRTKNKINSGWCIRVREMSRSINNCLRSKVSDMTSNLVLMDKVE